MLDSSPFSSHLATPCVCRRLARQAGCPRQASPQVPGDKSGATIAQRASEQLPILLRLSGGGGEDACAHCPSTLWPALTVAITNSQYPLLQGRLVTAPASNLSLQPQLSHEPHLAGSQAFGRLVALPAHRGRARRDRQGAAGLRRQGGPAAGAGAGGAARRQRAWSDGLHAVLGAQQPRAQRSALL